MKNKTRLIIIVVLTIMFLPLTYIKGTTAAISQRNDTTLRIVKTDKYFRLNNFYTYNTDNPGDDKDTWYSNGEYETLYADEVTGNYRVYYRRLIYLWWITGIMLIYNIRKFTLLQKKKKSELNPQYI